jgi:hypothetical protein
MGSARAVDHVAARAALDDGRAQREERSTRVDGAYGVTFKEYIAKPAAENEITRSQR